jgi:hypothetical protein
VRYREKKRREEEEEEEEEEDTDTGTGEERSSDPKSSRLRHCQMSEGDGLINVGVIIGHPQRHHGNMGAPHHN